MKLRRKTVMALVLGGVLLLAGVAVAMRSASNPVSMEVLTVTTNAQGWVTAKLQMTNHTSRVLSYGGYGSNAPLYRFVVSRPEGLSTNSPFWCGTGIRPVDFPAHSSIAFNAQWHATNAPMSVQLRMICPGLIDRISPHLPTQVHLLLARSRGEIVATAAVRP